MTKGVRDTLSIKLKPYLRVKYNFLSMLSFSLKCISFLFLTCLLPLSVLSQIITVDPLFPTPEDTVTITFDATQGNAGLAGIDQVYAHTGVITELSNPGQWRYVVGNWGTDDSRVKMTKIGENLHQLSYPMRSFYGVPVDEKILEMAFVFRNIDGSREGKTENGGDIFTPVFDGEEGLIAFFESLPPFGGIVEIGTNYEVVVSTSSVATIELFINDSLVSIETGQQLRFDYQFNESGNYTFKFIAFDNVDTVSGNQKALSLPSGPEHKTFPDTLQHGINHIDDTTVVLGLYAPQKEHIFLIGDFNNWDILIDYLLYFDPDSDVWWIELSGLDPKSEYGFQYLVDGTIRIADPYSELVLDPIYDQFIPESTFPDLKPYPRGKTEGIVGVFRPKRMEYDWQITDFQRPAIEDLVIYELLVRDFSEERNFQLVLDSLDYLRRLGVNAIELLPVNEFEGNISWGYNPSFHMALDKFYGRSEDLKRLIDEAHARGIAVIIDIVLNHAFSQSPLCQLYWDSQNFRPRPDNPWLNVTARHPFNVGYDFNHESEATQYWADRIMKYWIEEYNIDGYRFDLSKGFTQNFTTDVGVWSAYDASRVRLLKRMSDVIRDIDEDFYIILEHFAVDEEERELSDYGMLLWGNMWNNYKQASMSYSGSNFSRVSHKQRGFNDPHLIGYMESHDEERIMYENLNFGNSGSSAYDIRELPTALKRKELVNVFFYTIPGPKMLWQFGEFGYDYSLFHCPGGGTSENCKLDIKPTAWEYLAIPERQRLFQITSALIYLKKEYDVFRTEDFELDLNARFWKRIRLFGDDLNVNIIGNFDVETRDINPVFPHGGRWYEYFTGDSIEVANVNAPMNMLPGEYRLYTTLRLQQPDINTSVGFVPSFQSVSIELFPNPSNGENLNLKFNATQSGPIAIRIQDINGRVVDQAVLGEMPPGPVYINLNDYFHLNRLSEGSYFISLLTEYGMAVEKIVLIQD